MPNRNEFCGVIPGTDIQMREARCLFSGMAFTLQLLRRWLVLLLFLAAMGVVIAGSRAFLSTGMSASRFNNNPQQFHLWSTSNSFSYTFNCDPRMSDEWLFKTAGGTTFGVMSLNTVTNEWERR